MNDSTEVEIIGDPVSEGEVVKEPKPSKSSNVKIVASHHEEEIKDIPPPVPSEEHGRQG